VNAREKSSVIMKNNLEFKLSSIYVDFPDLPQIEFKKISENDFIYGTIRVKIVVDSRNSNLSGKLFIISLLTYIN
jgi:hypothetical protein